MMMKHLPRPPTCRACYRCLIHQIVCQKCFQEMAMKPFIPYKAQCRRKTRILQEKIEKIKIEPESLKQIRLLMERAKRRKRIKDMEAKLTKLKNRLTDQKKQIIDWQQLLLAKQQDARMMEETLALMSAQVSSKEQQLYERQRMLQKCQEHITIRKNQLLNDTRLLNQLTDSVTHKITLKINSLSLPVFEQQQQDVVIVESVQLHNPQNKGNIAIFMLEQLARRIQLLSNLSKIPLPYVVKCQPFDDICIGSKRMLIYVQGKITEPPKNISLLVSCDRKRKCSVYVDESALTQLQMDYEYLMSKVGINYEERINNSHLEQMLIKSQDFSTLLKNWQCNLNCSSVLSIERDKAILIHQQELEEELRAEQFYMINNDMAFSIHTSSEQMQFIDMDDETIN